VDEAADAADALGDERHLVVGELGVAELLDPAVVEEAPVVEAHHLLAVGEDLQENRLLEHREERADRDRHRLAGRRGQRLRLAGGRLGVDVVGNVAPQRVKRRRPVVRQDQAARIRVALGPDAEQVLEFPLSPRSRAYVRRDRGHPRVVGLGARAEHDPRPARVLREDVVDAEAVTEGPAVGTDADDEPGVEIRVNEPRGLTQVGRSHGGNDGARRLQAGTVDQFPAEVRRRGGEQRGGLRHPRTPFYRQTRNRKTNASASPIRFHAG
jgi:hypothetical protein